MQSNKIVGIFNRSCKITGLFFILLFLSIPLAHCQTTADSIRLNQLGFYPGGPKLAIIIVDEAHNFSVETSDGKTVFTGKLKQSATVDYSGKKTWVADFSSLHQTGSFILNVNGLGKSYSFQIQPDVYQKVATATLKAYYFQRASIPLAPKFAGIWQRAEGHPDTQVFIHPSAASNSRPAGTIISSPRGWYDAGDYNKYIVNSGITMGTLLSLYEDFPEHMTNVGLNIPESGDHLPDVLNEVLWNLRWMLTMQDPSDGGVYHKLTNANFDAFIMPDKATGKRYVVEKSTGAALEFAAVAAQASRIFKNFEGYCPGLSDSCLNASVSAWKWALQNKEAVYDQGALNKQFEPQITTGTYSSNHFGSEFIWAACELYITTGDDNYYKFTKLVHDNTIMLPNWGQVRLLGYYSLIRNKNKLTPVAKDDIPAISDQVVLLADQLFEGADASAYKTVMGKSARDFNWGSNATAANQGVALIQAYLITKNKKYLTYALSNLDYILGRNGTGYSFITGYGSKTPMHPHHRVSFADGVIAPVPGLMVGGANPGMQDGVKYPSLIPNQAYFDNDQAYACNEIAINWNAPIAYLLNAMEALKTKAFIDAAKN